MHHNQRVLAKYEFRRHHENSKAWFGRYLSPLNLPHWHEDAEILYCREGSAEVSIDDRVILLSVGDAAYVAGEQIHWVKSAKGSVLDFVIFDSGILGKDGASLCLGDPYLPKEKRVETLIDRVVEEKKGRAPLYQEACAAFVVETMSAFFREKPFSALKKRKSTDERYLSLLEKIDRECAYITFADASAFLGFTESYFSAYFRKKSGVTFSQYLNASRVEKAIPLIQAKERKMSDIASSCGFNTIRHFNRVFAEVTGYSPTRLPAGYSLSAWTKVRDLTAFDPTDISSTLLDSSLN